MGYHGIIRQTHEKSLNGGCRCQDSKHKSLSRGRYLSRYLDNCYLIIIFEKKKKKGNIKLSSTQVL